MTDDDVDHDLLDFMRLHLNGSCNLEVEETTGVIESAELIYDVRCPIHSAELTIRCQAAAEKVT
jgi:hypothetical protein